MITEIKNMLVAVLNENCQQPTYFRVKIRFLARKFSQQAKCHKKRLLVIRPLSLVIKKPIASCRPGRRKDAPLSGAVPALAGRCLPHLLPSFNQLVRRVLTSVQ